MSSSLLARLRGVKVYAYYSTRTWMLALTLASTLGWVVYGWDGVIEELWGGTSTYGTGVHWSTIQTFCLFSYLLTVNVQKGGIGLVGFIDAVKLDLQTNFRELEYRLAWIFGSKEEVQLARAKFRIVREKSEAHGPVGSMRGYAFTFLIVTFALMLFECLWVPLYDYFNFGNWAWPVYFAAWDKFGPIPFGSYGFVRNVGIATLGLILAPITLLSLFTKFRDEKGVLQLKRSLSIRWRFTTVWGLLLLIAGFFWTYWIMAPFPHQIVSPDSLPLSSIQSINPVPSNLLTLPLSFPAQVFFPQTDYTFYLQATSMQPYLPPQVYGFHINNDWLHFVNVATKYATYAAACYPAFVKVRKL